MLLGGEIHIHKTWNEWGSEISSKNGEQNYRVTTTVPFSVRNAPFACPARYLDTISSSFSRRWGWDDAWNLIFFLIPKMMNNKTHKLFSFNWIQFRAKCIPPKRALREKWKKRMNWSNQTRNIISSASAGHHQQQQRLNWFLINLISSIRTRWTVRGVRWTRQLLFICLQSLFKNQKLKSEGIPNGLPGRSVDVHLRKKFLFEKRK